MPPIPLQALVAALKLITSSVWFFSHALIAARKREDVQSYSASGCVETDHVWRFVLLARADGSTEA